MGGGCRWGDISEGLDHPEIANVQGDGQRHEIGEDSDRGVCAGFV